MTVVIWSKVVLAHLALELAFETIVLIQVDFWSIAHGTLAVVWNITLGAATNRSYRFIIRITPFEISHEIPVIPRLYIKDQREFINLKLLIFGRVRIIISPLLKGDISTDKVYKPAILLIELVDDFKKIKYNVHEHWLLSGVLVSRLTLYQKGRSMLFLF